MSDRDKEIFRDIYVYLYDLTQKVNKGLVVDQAALMQGAVALFRYWR